MNQIDKNKLPNHIAIIMDGNGRWAKEHGKQRTFGHRNGVISVREVVEGAAELQIKYLTLYAFSTENWNRPKLEVNTLMTLLVSTINKETKTLIKNNVRLLAIGDIENLPSKVQKELKGAIDKTAKNTGLALVLALNYSARWEIINALKKISVKVENQEIAAKNVDENLFIENLTTFNIPDPELLIRTSGEYRISNFLLWQIAYTELYFTNKLWPEFRKDDLKEAIINFQNRERRFGKTSEQIQTI
ncbi:MAG TPA: isoprenyl transferase [Bacteroidales bacterium]|nr:MAG: di-trans,poly-cis-decaprenylcistransferase [Bacteroidetes bacterium GWF2_33_38]OFY75296.1 MAG: di-trans,poly-cis-decaprenylcistransferase [Bacteroidetes bacterium RIFOXYA12_FULL_33_9]OFY88952.1 MAG: di-trans,poly-cis-decaprenylcistransferase [Bacteroidetes bacterium RIFOXYA2_FULL_33_7]HBF87805.1 isoprenyl transferase [Bacteroidales bacterium]